MTLITKPLIKNNYQYLNELLQTKDKKHTAESLNDKQERDELLPKLNAKQRELESEQSKSNNATEEKKRLIEDNLLKLKRMIDMLHDESKKKTYDAALAIAPSVNLQVGEKESNQQLLVPLVSIEDIIKEFNEFSNKKDAVGNLLIPIGCTYEKLEGPPVTHVFTFPDEKSKNEFLKILFEKNMAIFPNGSQSLEDIPSPQKGIKDELSALRRGTESSKEEKMATKPTIPNSN